MKLSSAPNRLLDASVRIDSIPAAGRSIEVTATADQRAAIAERLGILAVDSLTAKVTATRFRGGIRAMGQVTATAVQACVVTFEPVTEMVNEPLDRIFLPAGEIQQENEGVEVFVDLNGEDHPDVFDGPEADFSEFLIETVSLALNPYPRIPGADIAAVADLDDEAAANSPFASLRSLKPEGD